MIMAVSAAAVLSGCGDEPYTLTDKEESLIVDYSAHVVTKYNTYQKEGLTYVWEDEAEEEESEASQTVDSETQTGQNASAGTEVSDDTAISGDTGYAEDAVTLNEFFGEPDVTLAYVGARLADSYVEADYYAMYPDSGKQYLVLGIDITNSGQAPVDIDYLSMQAEYAVVLNGEVKTSSEMTLLMQDFSTFDAILKAGETRETVLLFQVPASVTSVENVSLTVTTDKSYQIILENE